MSNLTHWHGSPSEPSEPPACCLSTFETVLDRAVREAERDAEVRELDERKRFILDAIEKIGAYRDGMATVLTEDQFALVSRVADHCTELVRKAACICPWHDVSGYAEGEAPGSRYVKGLDPRCGLHGGAQ